MSLPPELNDLIQGLAVATVRGQNPLASDLRGRLDLVLRSAPPLSAEITWPVVELNQLPENAGVYVISSTTADEHYVGLALDLRQRFHNPSYGHLSPKNKSRSRLLLASGSYFVRLPHVADADTGIRGQHAARVWLSSREIETYVALVLAGGRVCNTFALLGRVGETPGSPVMLVDCRTAEYVYADTAFAASRFAKSRGLFAVLGRYQRTAGGFAARWATSSEAERLAEHARPDGVAQGLLVGAAVRNDEHSAIWDTTGRTARLRWTAGPLSASDLAELARYIRGRYVKSPPTKRFNGVSWAKHNRVWQCRAKTGPGPKEIWQVGRREWTEFQAALFREQQIIAAGWERFNFGAYGSNAEALNATLGMVTFSPWFKTTA